MTLEELNELHHVSGSSGRPTANMTDEKWQKELTMRKTYIVPYNADTKRLGGKFSTESGVWNEETERIYPGKTNWQSYCSYINDVLKNIRSGHVDFCYYTYQIIDLLKFHYDTLQTKYCDGYWEVWLL